MVLIGREVGFIVEVGRLVAEGTVAVSVEVGVVGIAGTGVAGTQPFRIMSRNIRDTRYNSPYLLTYTSRDIHEFENAGLNHSGV
jgi:hypothetical protein